MIISLEADDDAVRIAVCHPRTRVVALGLSETGVPLTVISDPPGTSICNPTMNPYLEMSVTEIPLITSTLGELVGTGIGTLEPSTTTAVISADSESVVSETEITHSPITSVSDPTKSLMRFQSLRVALYRMDTEVVA